MDADEALPRAATLPDEIISEILSPALKVSDEAFSHDSESARTFTKSPFMTFTESTSALLVVCKSWLRVSTPLLYHTVVLRSKAQAQALAATLKANPDLGTFIKRLRVEGGFAISMLKILQSSPNITDLFLSLDFASGDNACGLCRGLALVDPIRVTVDKSPRTRESAHTSKLLETLEECIPAWENLAVFKITHLVIRRTLIPEALKKSANLDTFSVSGVIITTQEVIPEYLFLVAENPSVKHIRVTPSHWVGSRPLKELRDAAKADARLRAVLDLAVAPSNKPSPLGATEKHDGPFSYPVQLSANPIAEDAIWSQVLYFALNRPRHQNPFYIPSRQPSPSRLAPLLVCKLFLRLGIPFLYERPALYSDFRVRALLEQLAMKPELGQHIQCLSVGPLREFPMLKDIVAHTPTLTELHGTTGSPSITWKAFTTLGESTGSSLRSFHGIPIPKTAAANPAAFALFTEMRELGWATNTTFKTTAKFIPTDAFRFLVKLTVTTCDESFLTVLAHMELPALQSAIFAAGAAGGTRFFSKHGAKLRELTLSVAQIANKKLGIWQNCPQIKVLGVSCDHKHPAIPSCFDTEDTHTQLECIVFKLAGDSISRLKQAHMTALGTLLSELGDTKAFPALQTIQHPHCSWPTTENEIKKSKWVAWAEGLMEREGRPPIYLVGRDGVRWRPRLKFVSKPTKK
ncbi:hypothetical protein B0H16DRAFT_1539043 [Mycena metata]|uniref:Uncharacterized protein n=1 Tax=Mycena metata TaxID=1033252 RepID=A0AAD7NDE8_9AGAR|nr:hypothetical protein B0H16DRAFT_1539043 [Mycena metata]